MPVMDFTLGERQQAVADLAAEVLGADRPRAADPWKDLARAGLLDVSPPDGLGVQPGKIKHVWLIILENKSYDETFTGLNQNSYLWQTLPQQGALLTNYYGTGHFSMDNYISRSSRPRPTSRPSARPGPPNRGPTASTAPTACWPTPPARTSTATT